MGIFSKFFKKNKTISKRRKYEAASRAKRLSNWKTASTDANTENQVSLTILRNRARDLHRNNSYAHKAISVIESNIVGHGIKTKFSDAAVQDAWNIWAEGTDCDFLGHQNFYGLQRLVAKTVSLSGECLMRERMNSNNEIALQYQALEGDFINDEVKLNNKDIINGVEVDKNGRILGYHLYDRHPSAFVSTLAPNQVNSNFLPKSEILHSYRIDRPGQLRGVPWLHPIMIRVKDIDEFIDATVLKQKVASCFAGFVTDMNAEVIDPDIEDDSDMDFAERIEPGIIEMLPPGKSITFSNPPDVENFGNFVSALGRQVASGMGISYESLTGDLENVSFSGGKLGSMEMERNIQSWRNDILINMFIEPAVKRFIEVYSLKNGRNISNVKWSHIPPKRIMIDPQKEIQASIRSVRAGLSSISEEISSFGKDPDKVLEQIAEDNAKLDELGIILDTDPRQTTFAGIAQAEQSDGPNSEGENV